MVWLLVPLGVLAVLLAVVGARFAHAPDYKRNAIASGGRSFRFSANGSRPNSSKSPLIAASRAACAGQTARSTTKSPTRQRETGELCALVGVTISFEAIVGGGMEEVEAVGNLRSATAVFRVVDGRWQTDGRAIFNLNPIEAIAYYQENLSPIGPSGA